MSRLTKYESVAGHAHAIPMVDADIAIQKLAEFENLEEQGLLLRFPCKVGDTVYCWRTVVPTKYTNFGIERWLETDNKIIPGRVVSIRVTKKGVFIKVALKGECFVSSMWGGEDITTDDYEYCNYSLSAGSIGKTVFLTKEEAEAALENMKGE